MDRNTYICPHKRERKDISLEFTQGFRNREQQESDSSEDRRTGRIYRRDRSERLSRNSSKSRNGNRRDDRRHSETSSQTHAFDTKINAISDTFPNEDTNLRSSHVDEQLQNNLCETSRVTKCTPTSSRKNVLQQYPRAWNDRVRSDPRERELFQKLSKAHSKSNSERWNEKDWGKKPPGVTWGEDHYIVWRCVYNKYIEVMYENIIEILKEFKDFQDTEVDFEEFAEFAYLCSSGYITPYS